MPVGVHCTMRKYSRINWCYYLWNAGLVVSVIVDRAKPICVHLTQRQISYPTPVTQFATRTMFLYFCCPNCGFLLCFPRRPTYQHPFGQVGLSPTYWLPHPFGLTALAFIPTLVFCTRLRCFLRPPKAVFRCV